MTERSTFAWPCEKEKEAERLERERQGLTLVHISAQPEPFLVTNSTHRPIVSHKTCLR